MYLSWGQPKRRMYVVFLSRQEEKVVVAVDCDLTKECGP